MMHCMTCAFNAANLSIECCFDLLQCCGGFILSDKLLATASLLELVGTEATPP